MMSIWSATPLAHLTYDPSELKFGTFCLFVILAFSRFGIGSDWPSSWPLLTCCFHSDVIFSSLFKIQQFLKL